MKGAINIDLTGIILKGRYCIVEQVGRGGEGSMYLARDLELGIFRAVKELPASSRREAGLLRLLEHPYLPKIDVYKRQSDGNSFMTIKSKEGYYVKGTVSELMLDQIKEGTILNCSSQNGDFEAEVIDLSEYPVSGDNYSGNGNPNVSYYTYIATIPDKTVKVSDEDWLTISLTNNTQSKGIVLDRAFVRSENGASYVYKDDNGVLKKQVLTVGGNVNGGYSVPVSYTHLELHGRKLWTVSVLTNRICVLVWNCMM